MSGQKVTSFEGLRVAENIPIDPRVLSEELARCAVFSLSDDASVALGHTIAAIGGSIEELVAPTLLNRCARGTPRRRASE